MNNPWNDEDMALKLLHTADWHLGLRHRWLPDEAERKLTRARLDVIDRILGAAEEFQVDAVLCAGDLFDTHDPDREWWQGLLGRLQNCHWNGRQMFLLPGNHDPLSGAASVYHEDHPFRKQLPAWVHVVERENQEFPLGDDAVLYASPCRAAAGANEPASSFPHRPDDDRRIRIGMLHGQTSGFAGRLANFPIDAEAAGRCGLDYLALGDQHDCLTVSDPPPVVYPGPPEPTRMGESGGQVMLVMFRRSGGAPIVHRHRVGRWRWVAKSCSSLDELRSVREMDALQTTVLRLKLEFSASVAELDEIDALIDELQGTAAAHGLAGVLTVDRSGLRQLPPTPELAEQLPEPLQEALEKLCAAEVASEEVRQRAIYHLFQLHKSCET